MGLRHWLGLSELTPREAAPYDLMPGATLDQVRKLIAEQAHGEVMQPAAGPASHHRASAFEPGGPMFTVAVERMERACQGTKRKRPAKKTRSR
jgi:hypothetical protein